MTTQPGGDVEVTAAISAGPELLSPAEQETWRAFLAVHRTVFAALEAQLQSNAGMPLAYYSILVALAEAPARTLRMGGLTAKLHSSPSTISHAITRLESWGWVYRRNDRADRRVQLAVLTDRGHQAQIEAAPGHVAAVRTHLFSLLTSEQVRQIGAHCEAVLRGHIQAH